jgi:hypothetical protein
MNPNKIYEAQPDFVFSGVVYKSMNNLAKLNFQLTSVLSHYIVNWVEQKDMEDMSTYFEGFYVQSLNDLAKLERGFVGKDGYENTGNILQVWKSYLYYVMVSSFGGVPMSEANRIAIQPSYKYDSEKDIYREILAMLDQAVETFDVNGDKLAQDPVFRSTDGSSDIAKWRKFANSLRLNVALTIQNMDSGLAEEHIRKALSGGNENYLISSVDDIAKFTFGSDLNMDASYYYRDFLYKYESGEESGHGRYPAMSHNFFLYMKSYDDPRLPKFAKEATMANKDMPTIIDTLTRVNTKFPNLRDSITVKYGLPFVPRKDFKVEPVGWTVAVNPLSPTGERYRSPYSDIQISSAGNECFISKDFIKANANMVMISWADVCFMKAEVAVKYPGILSGTAQQYYEEGVKASMSQYGVSTSAVNTYLDQPGVKWNTNGEGCWEYRHFYKADIKGENNPLEQIYKQWYIANFYNGHAGWTLERRTRAVNFPPHFYNGLNSTEGSNGICDYMQERLLYPQSEIRYNQAGYLQGVADLQANSPVPKPYRGGDNFFTSLQIAAPQPNNGDLTGWLSGEIVYDGGFIRHWYGTSREEMLAKLGIIEGKNADRELTTMIGYDLKSVVIYCTYNPENGKRYNPNTGEPLIPDTEDGDKLEQE